MSNIIIYVITYFLKKLVINYQNYKLRIYINMMNYQAMYSNNIPYHLKRIYESLTRRQREIYDDFISRDAKILYLEGLIEERKNQYVYLKYSYMLSKMLILHYNL